jgi:hypothetical protein
MNSVCSCIALNFKYYHQRSQAATAALHTTHVIVRREEAAEARAAADRFHDHCDCSRSPAAESCAGLMSQTPQCQHVTRLLWLSFFCKVQQTTGSSVMHQVPKEGGLFPKSYTVFLFCAMNFCPPSVLRTFDPSRRSQCKCVASDDVCDDSLPKYSFQAHKRSQH